MFQNLIPSTFTRAILAAFLFIAAVLPSQAQQFDDFTYTATATEVIITGYTGTGGAVTIPSSIGGLPVTDIWSNAFNQKTTLTSVSIPGSVTTIGDYAFQGCTGLTSVTIPNSVTSIGESAFDSCGGLTSVTIPNSVTSIGIYAFYKCTGLTNVTIGNGVTLLDSAVFASCTGLTSVTIGNGVTRIGQQPFNNCLKLAGIYFQGNAPYFDYGVLLDTDTNTLVYFVVGTYGWSSSFGGKTTVALGPPIINEQPFSAIANLGESVEFSVLASSSIPLPLSYQWKRNGITIQGATTATLSLNGVLGTNAGSYFVVVTNQYGSVRSINASLTLSQGNLYTQAQFDSAFKTGYDLGVSSGGSDADVLANPNSYGLYSLTQVQSLNVGTPLLVKNPTTGKFKLTVGVEKSTNLVNFTPMPIPGSAVINSQGKMEFEFTSTDNAAFFRVGSK